MKGSKRAPLIVSIAKVLTTYFIVETIGFIAIGMTYAFPRSTLVLFSVVQIVFYIGLSCFLIAGKNFFFIEATGKRLDKVNIANKITLIRVSMLPSILFLILSARDHSIAPILLTALAVAFITDMIDGRLSRALNEVTRMGRILDSVSDYSLLIVIAIAYRVFDLLPAWLFAIIFARLFFQALGMLAVLIVRKRVEPQPTVFGKLAIATTMSLFAIEALKLVVPKSLFWIFFCVEILAGAIVGISILDKAYFFTKQARPSPRS